MSEELNQQLAEAAGYSGMKSLVAQAYLMSTGKSKEEAKADKDAMQKLTDAMKNSAAKTDKVFPFLVDLMREASSGGVAAAQKSSGAEEDRFWNRMQKGWENFTKGGGERGIAAFWQDLQTSIGAWWEENGASIGKSFEKAVQWFKVFRIGLTDFVKFMWTGETNSFVNWLAQEKGIDLTQLRVFFREMYVGLKEMFSNIGKSLGIIDSEGNFDFGEFSKRVSAFIEKVGEAIRLLMDSLKHFSEGLIYIAEILKGGTKGVFNALFNKHSPEAKFLDEAAKSFGRGVGAFAGSTSSALGGQLALVTPSGEFTGISESGPAANIARIRGESTWEKSAVGAMASSNHLFGNTYSVLNTLRAYTNKLFGINPSEAEAFKAGEKYGLYPYTHTRNNSVPEQAGLINAASGVGQRQQFDVNVNLKVEGDPDVLRNVDTDYLVEQLGNRVLGKVNYSIMSSLPDAPRH